MALLGGASERLDFVLTANADQAVRSFKQVGNAADRELGRAENKLDRLGSRLTTFGAGGLAFSAVALTGLKSLADGASDVGEAMSAVEQVFGDAAPAVEEFAEGASKIGLAKGPALDAARGFGVLGKAAGKGGQDLSTFSVDLTKLAADMASFSNTSVDEAVQALSSGLRGEAEPLRKYGVLLDDAALKAEAMALGIYDGNGSLSQQEKILAANSAIFKQTADQQGDYARTSDGLANSQRTLAAEMQNLKDEVGAGVVPVFQTLVGAAGGVADVFNGLPGPVKATVGGFAAWGTVGIAAVSALSLIAGQAIKMRTTLGPLAAKIRTAEGGLTGLGRAAKGASIALGTLIIADQVFGAINEGAGYADQAADALNRMSIALDKGSKANAFDAFADAAAAEQNTLRLSNLWEEFGAEIELVGTGVKSDVEQMQRAFDTLTPEQALAVLDELRTRTEESLDAGSDQYKRNIEFIERNSDALENKSQADKIAADSTDELSDSLEEAATNAETLTEALEGTVAGGKLIESIVDGAKGLGDAFTKGLDVSSTLDDAIDSTQGLADSWRTLEDQVGKGDFKKAVKELPEDLREIDFTTLTEGASKVLDDFQALGKSAGEALGTEIGRGADFETVKKSAEGYREQIRKLGTDAGLTGTQIDQILEQAGLLSDEQIEIAIQLTGYEKLQLQLSLMQSQIDDLPPEVLTEVNTLVNQGKYLDASNLLALLTAPRETQLAFEAGLRGETPEQIIQGATPEGGVNIPVKPKADPNFDFVGAIFGGSGVRAKPSVSIPVTAETSQATASVGKVQDAASEPAEKFIGANTGEADWKRARLETDIKAKTTKFIGANTGEADWKRVRLETDIRVKTDKPVGLNPAAAYSALSALEARISRPVTKSVTIGENTVSSGGGGGGGPEPGGFAIQPAAVASGPTVVTNNVYLPASANGRDVQRSIRRELARNGSVA